MLIQKKILERKLCQLSFIPSLIICLIVSGFFYVKFIDHQENNLKQQLHFIAGLFQHAHIDNTDGLNHLSDNILSKGHYYNISLYSKDKTQFFQRGVRSDNTAITPLLATNERRQFINGTLYYSKPISYRTSDTEQDGWLLITRDGYVNSVWYYQAALIFVVLNIGSLLLILLLTRRFEKYFFSELQPIKQGLEILKSEKFDEQIGDSQHTLFSPLIKSFNDTFSHLETSRHDLQQAIDQSLLDLRETLETVEIQNIEIDLARKNALRANQATSEFLANTSHEIRTPINGIVGFTNLLRKTNITHQQAEYIDTIEESAKVLLLNINDILDYSRLEIGKLNLDYKPVNVREFVAEAEKFACAQSKINAVKIISKVSKATPEKLLGDSMRLKQVYNNLLGCTIELCRSNTIRSQIDIEDRDDNKITLKITISAQGDFAENRLLREANKIVSALSPDNEPLKNKHLMSLVIAKGLITRMKGQVGMRLKEHECIFWFTVELGQSSPALPSTNTAQLPKQEEMPVLVVDDNPSNRRLVCELFKDMGLKTEQAESGEEAIEIFQQKQFALILMDIQMPGLNGFETTKKLRELEEKTRTPIIALTAHAVEEEKSELLTSGMDDFVSKPIGDVELRELLLRWTAQTPKPKMSDTQEISISQITDQIEAISDTTLANAPVHISSCIELAKGKTDLAKDMLAMLIDTVNDSLPSMRDDFDQKHYDPFQEAVHKIHGGACYCGVPELLTASSQLDISLKNKDYSEIDTLSQAFFQACENLLTWQTEHDIDVLFSG